MASIPEQNNTQPSGLVVGSPVTGEDFFDRETELNDFITFLTQGTHLLITAPRRTGKTSLLKEAARRLAEARYCLYVDLQGCVSEAEAMVKIVEEARPFRDLKHLVTDVFKNVLGALTNRLEEIQVSELKLKLLEGVTPDWQAKGSELLQRLAQAEKPVVLLFDELPVLVNRLLKGTEGRLTPERRRQTHVFLSWLREATIRHQGRLAFVVCGSIGLEPLLHQAGISETVNTFMSFELPPWDREMARRFIFDRAERSGLLFQDGAENKLLDSLGLGIPHHVQMFMSFIHRDPQCRKSGRCAPPDVRRVYQEKMLSLHGHVELRTYEDRLKVMLSQEQFEAALELLTEAAVTGRLDFDTGTRIVRSHLGPHYEAARELRFLLGLFEHDGYLKKRGRSFRFESKLLRDWWKKHFSSGYRPMAKRSEGEN
ncbi:MAG: ATP-binding protein [Thermodesulfobacteriota bacterium]